MAFAVVTVSGDIVAWGNSEYGGTISAAAMAAIVAGGGAASIHSTHSAFAVVTASGHIVVWSGLHTRGCGRCGGWQHGRLRPLELLRLRSCSLLQCGVPTQAVRRLGRRVHAQDSRDHARPRLH
jgi:hypothetical protein